MSASESVPAALDLHNSIDQVIAEAEKRGRAAAEAETLQLTSALQAALEEIETSQQALSRAATALRAALGTAADEVPAPGVAELAPLIKEEPAAPEGETAESNPMPDRGEHEMDVIAHHASIGTASGLQTMLRSRPEVKSAQTREFVNGELRLQVCLRSDLDMAAFKSWLHEQNGTLVTTTDSVIETRFSS